MGSTTLTNKIMPARGRTTVAKQSARSTTDFGAVLRRLTSATAPSYWARWRASGYSVATASPLPVRIDSLAAADAALEKFRLSASQSAPRLVASLPSLSVGAAPPAIVPSTSSSVAAPTALLKVSGGNPMALENYPHPPGDNGRGIHWIPTVSSSPDVVDRFVREAKEMHMKWVTFLNDGANIGSNDYLVKKLAEAGIEPVMRVYTTKVGPISGDVTAMVRHYRELGVHYFQLFNEPNLNVENGGKAPNVDSYLDAWIPAAKQVVAGGGLPGLGALAPGGNYDDVKFLDQALQGIISRGEAGVLDHAWISEHNYLLNHPLNYSKDSNGFLKFRWYDDVVRQRLGRSLPIIGTEGGAYSGEGQDSMMPAVGADDKNDRVMGAYRYMAKREPYNFAYTYWVLANEEGGGHDPAWRKQALFQPGFTDPLVEKLKQLP